ncbi:MAG: DUF3307 domain-containing protein [Candidatus Margulisiibacteriota bacterium]
MIHTFFLTLLFAHAIADYPLQTTPVYKFKIKSFWGIVLHVLIITLFTLVTIYAVGWEFNPGILLFIALLAGLHIIEDKLKLSVYRGNDFFWYIIDQVIHILCMALIYILPITLVTTSWNLGSAVNYYLLAITGIVYASYAASIGIHFYIKAYKEPMIGYKRNWMEIVELGFWATAFFLFCKYFILIALAGLLVKFIAKKYLNVPELGRMINIVIPFIVFILFCGVNFLINNYTMTF